jgi:hypothetical protein
VLAALAPSSLVSDDGDSPGSFDILISMLLTAVRCR